MISKGLGGKMKKILFFLVAVLIVISSYGILINTNKHYSTIINANWSINLPKSYKEIYSIDSGSSLNGDGERYHMFQYEKVSDINEALVWKSSKNTMMESEINIITNYLEVEDEYMPDFQNNYKYFIQYSSDTSTIYLILFEETKLLFIVEDFY